jgi:hypothetical protein
MNIEDVLSEIETKTDFKFLYEKDVFEKSKVTSISSKKEKLADVLKRLFKTLDVDYQVLNKQIVIVKKSEETTVINSIKKAIKNLKQQSLQGKVTDESGMPLPGATVVYKGINKGVSTDFDGNFRMAYQESATAIVVSYMGYHTQEIIINNKTVINVRLKPMVTGLEETVI